MRAWCFLSSLLKFLIYNKQLLDEVFVISRIIKVEVGVISRSDNPYRDVDYSGCLIIVFYTLNEKKKMEVMFLLHH